MSSTENGPVGRTRWGVFGLVLLPCGIVVAVLAAALLNGVLAASLAVAGVPIQLKVDRLEGEELTLYGSEIDPVSGGNEASARAGIAEATISGLCLGLGAEVPVLGQVAVKVNSSQDVEGSNLLLDARSLQGDLLATDAAVGQDASAFSIGVPSARGPAGTPGLQAGRVVLDGDVDVALFSLMAGSLKLDGVRVEAVSGTTSPC